jgi:hypothetical protein
VPRHVRKSAICGIDARRAIAAWRKKAERADTQVELFHHSMNVPANITKLVNISEKGQVVKDRPR